VSWWAVRDRSGLWRRQEWQRKGRPVREKRARHWFSLFRPLILTASDRSSDSGVLRERRRRLPLSCLALAECRGIFDRQRCFRRMRGAMHPRRRGRARIAGGGAPSVANAAAKLFLQRRQQVEGDVGGLEALTLRVGDVVGERAVGAEARRGRGLDAMRESCGVAAGKQAGGDGLGVAFDAAELARDEKSMGGRGVAASPSAAPGR